MPDAEPRENESKDPQDTLSVTQHTAIIGGETLRYTVTAGTVVLREESEGGDEAGVYEGATPKATLFFVAYTKDGEMKDSEMKDGEEGAARPVTFSFNGGPGSSSVWLHLGVLGPKRVALDEAGNPPPPPYRLVDNEHSLLGETDLVFIDPVGTGYSRAAPGEKASRFHEFEKDVASVGDFIRLYTSRYGRWASPKFLVGESYGTTRAAGLSGYLQERHGMYLNGVMLISAVLDFQTLRFEVGNDLPYLLYLPTYAATAWYHQKLPSDLQEKSLRDVLEEVEAFALGDYALALMKGASLPAEARADVARRLSRYTGLSESYLGRADLRVTINRFVKELLRDERRTVGRLDGRFTGVDRDAAGEIFEYDPSYAAIQGPYTATFNQYVRQELGFESDLSYEILTNLYESWSYKTFEGRYVSVTDTLRKALNQNPYLRVFVGSGYYDLATPYFAAEYTLNHLGLEPERRENVTTSFYEAGHMMYVHAGSLEKLKADLARFVAQAVQG